MIAALSLSQEQQVASQMINRRLLIERGDFVLGGLAGTGKTTLIKHLVDGWQGRGHNPLVVAPTAKAAYRLSQVGVKACTIHQWLYRPVGNEEDERGELRPIFVAKQSPARPSLVICDESSMVPEYIYQRIRRQGVPVLYSLDPGQLPPVRAADPKLQPDFTLTQIHRQAQGSPIITLAHAIRNGTGDIYRAPDGIDVYPMATLATIVDKFFGEAIDHLIVQRNDTRIAINQAIHQQLHPGSRDLLHPGDVIICLNNNYGVGVLNGQCFVVDSVVNIHGGYWTIAVRPEEGGDLSYIKVVADQFNQKNRLDVSDLDDSAVLADYGWAITCHKAQGSQWDHVGVIPPVWRGMPDRAKWEYTAVTRAAKRLSIFQAV